jgi:P-type Cu2+ transporter
MSTILANAALLNAQAGSDPRAHVLCTHCSELVPAGLVEQSSPHQFCCTGCKIAYEIIHANGLDHYYALRDSTNSPATPLTPAPASNNFTEFDDPAFAALYCRQGCAGLATVDLMLEGVHCAACVWLIERLPRLAKGVVEARLDFRRRLVRITWDPALTQLSAVASALNSIGYRPHPARGVSARALRTRDDRTHLIRLAVAGACAGNAMLLAMALYAGMFGGIEHEYRLLFEWTSVLIGLISLAWPGRVFFVSSLAAIRTRTLNLDLPITLGIAAGALWSIIAAIRGSGEVYFDSISVLVFLLLVGRFIQHRQQRWSADAVEMLFALTPTSARVLRSDGCGGTGVPPVRNGPAPTLSHDAPSTTNSEAFTKQTVERAVILPIESIAVGDLVEVLAGETIPVDGTITRGSSNVDQSLLTGESRPVPVTIGDHAAAGSLNVSARLVVTCEATGESTRIGKLLNLVQEGAARRAPIVRLADRWSGRFIIGMLSAAAITFFYWLRIDPAAAINNAAALLIVTCPCALGLATPLVLTVALGRSAARGVMIKGGDTVERLSNPGIVYLDKTGTVTQGRTSLVDFRGSAETLRLAASLEAHSAHPIARAFVEAHQRLDPTSSLFIADEVRETTGGGIEGLIAARRVRVGSLTWILNQRESNIASQTQGGTGVSPVRDSKSVEQNPQAAAINSQKTRSLSTAPRAMDAEARRHAAAFAAAALSPVCIEIDNEILGVAAAGDPIRDDAATSIARLRKRGWQVRLLSGDDPTVVTNVAQQIGLSTNEAAGGITPEGKLAEISRAKQLHAAANTPIVMVGDGVNDAAALAAADVGIAVHGGAEASLAAADVYINHPGLAAIVDLVDGSARTLRVIRLTLGVSIFYNAVAAALAIAGLINPLIAAILMPLSSLTVLFIAFKSRTFNLSRGAFTNWRLAGERAMRGEVIAPPFAKGAA